MLTELKGVWLISLEEGAIVGKVTGMVIDPATRAISALSYKATKGPDGYVTTDLVERVGRDVILVKTETGTKHDGKAPGRSLQSLQGAWVTTSDGHHLGTLVDVEFSNTDWKITELEMAEDKALPVTAAEIAIGDDVIVPASYVDNIKVMPKEKYGAIGRMMGTDRIDDVRDSIKQMLSRKKKEDDK